MLMMYLVVEHHKNAKRCDIFYNTLCGCHHIIHTVFPSTIQKSRGGELNLYWSFLLMDG